MHPERRLAARRAVGGRTVRPWSSPPSSRRTCWRPPRGSSPSPPSCPDVRLGLVTCEPVGADPAGPARSGWPVTGGSTTRSTRGSSPGGVAASPGSWAGSSGSSAPSSSSRCRWPRSARRLGIDGHGRADRAQRPRQVADEGGAAGRRRARAPATRSCATPGEATAVRRRRSGSRWSSSRRPVRARRRRSGSTTATCCGAGWRPCRSARGLARAARGVPHRRGAHLRQRHASAARRCGRRSPTTRRRRWRCCATRGSSGRVAAAPRHRRPASTRASTGGGRRRCRRSACATRSRHMEWFAGPTARSPSRRSAARPPGAQLTSMHGYAHDFDLYRAWAELVVLGRFDAARAPVRGRDGVPARQGHGRVRAVHGIDARPAADRAPGRRGAAAAAGPAGGERLQGEGYVIVRDPDTAVVEDALQPHRQRRPRRAGRGLTRGPR